MAVQGGRPRKVTGEHWLQGAIKRPGALHKALNVPAGKKIPATKLNAAAKRTGRVGQEARLAKNMRSFKKK